VKYEVDSGILNNLTINQAAKRNPKRAYNTAFKIKQAMKSESLVGTDTFGKFVDVLNGDESESLRCVN